MTASTAQPPILVHAESLVQGMNVESTAQSGLWDGWSSEDRQFVEQIYAAALGELESTPHERDVMVAPDSRAAALVQSTIQEMAWTGELSTRTLDTGQREALYDNRDYAGWAGTLFGGLLQKLKMGRFDFLPPSLTPTPIPNDCRIAILGDWGTGTYGGPHCGASIASDPEGFDLVLHLGDVYYSGTKDEVQTNFLNAWPHAHERKTSAPISRACNSNHEMYSGGHPYAELTLPAFGQDSSVFALENDNWVILGLDTAYDEWSLAQGQLAWVRKLLARDDGRRAILLSHHQPFSHFSAPNSGLRDQIDSVLADDRVRGKVHAWYFGHEHIGAIYECDDRWGLRGRCVGHSAFPYFRPSVLTSLARADAIDISSGEWLVSVPQGVATPAATIVDGPNTFVGNNVGQQARYGPNGFMTVALVGTAMREQLLTADGKQLWELES